MPKQIVPYLSGFFPLPLPLSLLLHYFPPFPGPRPSLIWVSNKPMYYLAIWTHSHPLTLFHRLHYIMVTPWKSNEVNCPFDHSRPAILLLHSYQRTHQPTSNLTRCTDHSWAPSLCMVTAMHSNTSMDTLSEVGLMATDVYILIPIQSLPSLKAELPNTPTAVP